MSKLLYYSNYCTNSNNILAKLSKSSVKKDIHFICIDKRYKRDNKTYIVLENNDSIILPENITSVPALLLLNNNFKILYGNEILSYLNPIEETNNQISTNFNGEPTSFMFNSNSSHIVSDNYSFLNQNSDELSAKGDGGLRQLYSYSTLQNDDRIVTPPDDYLPDKINEDSLKQYSDSRNNI